MGEEVVGKGWGGVEMVSFINHPPRRSVARLATLLAIFLIESYYPDDRWAQRRDGVDNDVSSARPGCFQRSDDTCWSAPFVRHPITGDFIGLSHARLPRILTKLRGSCKLIYGNAGRSRGQMPLHGLRPWIPVMQVYGGPEGNAR